VEPLGVHADFRRKGLGRALLAETFRRMAGLGVPRVYVECDGYPDGPDYLNYQSAGFALERKFLVFRKDFMLV
jgi:ribosomal protein S18 acetylase RimI-like enzyme